MAKTKERQLAKERSLLVLLALKNGYYSAAKSMHCNSGRAYYWTSKLILNSHPNQWGGTRKCLFSVSECKLLFDLFINVVNIEPS